jgi:putative transposase
VAGASGPGSPRRPGFRVLAVSGHLHQMLRQYEGHHNEHRPHRSLHSAAPLKPLPEAADLDHYRIRKRARVGGLINEYYLVA